MSNASEQKPQAHTSKRLSSMPPVPEIVRNASYSSAGGTAVTLAQFQSVVNNLTDLYVGADYTDGNTGTGTTETTTLDNVVLAIPAAAPEPGAIALLLTAGVPVVGLVRRRKASR